MSATAYRRTSQSNDSAFWLVSAALLLAVISIMSVFFRIDHANYFAQVFYLTGAGLAGLRFGITMELDHQIDIRKGEAGAGPVAWIIWMMFWGNLIIFTSIAWWAVATGGHCHSSFWLLSVASLNLFSLAGIAGHRVAM